MSIGWRLPARVRGAAIAACAVALMGTGVAQGATATYTGTETIPVPPASNYAGGGGGDGWGIALSSSQVFNVFHHQGSLTVACHEQADASPCWNPETITDASGNGFASQAQPGMYLDQSTGKLYVFATRGSDSTGGVVCIDTTKGATSTDPFCGFTALTAAGGAPLGGGYDDSTISAPMLVGHDLYAFNYVDGVAAGNGADQLLCFDTSTDAACAGQPFSVNIGTGTMSVSGYPGNPAVSAIGTELILPVTVGNTDELACFNTTTQQSCGGQFPLSIASGYVSDYGAPFPLMNANGAITGFCLPTGSDPCYGLDGAAAATPAGMTGAITGGTPWNGGAFVLGPRVYVPEGGIDKVACFDYSTGSSCANFPKSFSGLSYLYTVNPDPARPTCIWVNADGGSSQIQNFDAYTGGACGHGAVRVLASQFVVNKPACTPATYTKVGILQPDPTQYNPTQSTVEFDDGDGNAIAAITPNPQQLDAHGFVSLAGMGLNTNTGLPQFLFTLNGLTGTLGQVVVQLTWTGDYDPSCVGPGTQVTSTPTSLTASPAVADVELTGAATPLKLSATLTAGGHPVANEPLTFSTGGKAVCTAVTDATGTAQCTDVVNHLLPAVLNGGYSVAFAGDGQLLSSTAQGSIIVVLGTKLL